MVEAFVQQKMDFFIIEELEALWEMLGIYSERETGTQLFAGMTLCRNWVSEKRLIVPVSVFSQPL